MIDFDGRSSRGPLDELQPNRLAADLCLLMKWYRCPNKITGLCFGERRNTSKPQRLRTVSGNSPTVAACISTTSQKSPSLHRTRCILLEMNLNGCEKK